MRHEISYCSVEELHSNESEREEKMRARTVTHEKEDESSERQRRRKREREGEWSKKKKRKEQEEKSGREIKASARSFNFVCDVNRTSDCQWTSGDTSERENGKKGDKKGKTIIRAYTCHFRREKGEKEGTCYSQVSAGEALRKWRCTFHFTRKGGIECVSSLTNGLFDCFDVRTRKYTNLSIRIDSFVPVVIDFADETERVALSQVKFYRCFRFKVEFSSSSTFLFTIEVIARNQTLMEGRVGERVGEEKRKSIK